MNQSLFRKNSLDGISSPDQLNDYIKVSNPRIWMVLAALFILLAAVFIWGFAGSLPTTVHATGAALSGGAVCFVAPEDAEKISVGQKVTATADGEDLQGQVTDVGRIPLSKNEVESELGSDYLAESLAANDYAVKVSITLDNTSLADATLLDIRIVTDSVRPIDFLLQ